MKKLLSILGAITLVGTSTTSLVACNKPQYSEDELKKEKEKHKIDTKDQTIKNNLEWMASQEKPFNTVDNKYYYVVWRGNKNDNWKITKFLNDTNNEKKIDNYNKYSLIFKPSRFRYYTLLIKEGIINTTNTWYADNGSYFKSVFRWNLLDKASPDLIIDDKGNVKVINGE
ncbi:lipoprotein [Spiroplasma endosymbiont of Ammophila pubescens]|uniref:lipoprotein n=1 Tax=Spiroplasma endosymbiont of Ammophila pubescens TaxID=3066315 RepID=UPI0032B27F24